ncbi:MAG: CxxC-x17-CxxC domain-containing protein [Candidatus Omnitrophota bacterium]|jgi:CxxC-x17-CxxC domain-containing protein
MKKKFRRKSPAIPQDSGDGQDIAFLINKMQGQLTSLERKIDMLIAQPSAKPFQRFDRPRHDNRENRDHNFRDRNFTKVICCDCGKECEVPFKPSGDRPVYCKECFSKRKNRDSFKGNQDNTPRKEGFFREQHFDKQRNPESRKPGRKKRVGFRKRKS